MSFFPCSCPLSCNKTRSECQKKSTHHQSEPSTSTSLLSQPSLPLVPSLSSPLQSSTVEQQCLATIKGHSSYVSSLALSRKSLFTGSSNGEIRVWPREPPSSSTGNIVGAGSGGVKSLVILGDKLISAHQDHKIRVWKTNDDVKYKCVATLPTMNDRLTSLFSQKSYVEVRRHKKSTWVHHVDAVSSLALSQDGSLLYSASWDRSFKVWRTSDFKCLDSIEKAHDDAINAVVVSRDGFCYTGSADKTIKVWIKKGNHSLVATLKKHLSAVNALAVSEDGKVLYSGACDRSILVWERLSNGDDGDDEELHMTVVGALRGHTKAIMCLKVASDLVLSGSADKSLRVWRRGLLEKDGYSCLAVLEGHTKPVKCLAVSVSDSGSDYSCMVYSGSLDLSVKVWSLRVSSV
ncbi:F3 protein [Hirschfeldia incana]|nr:F3 protein [Hirschfeldia incana]